MTWPTTAGRYYLAVRHQLDQGKYNGAAYGAYTLSIQADWAPPTAPGNFRAALSGEDVLLSFDPSADDIGGLEYDIYRNGRLLAATAQTSYTDRAVQWNTAYTYYAQARDLAGRRSPSSASAEIVTEADTTPPTAPWLYLAGYSDKAVTLAWTLSEDRSGIYRYLVFRNGSQIASLSARNSSAYYIDRDDFRPGETHGYYIKAVDNNGLESTSNYQSVSISSQASIEQIHPLAGAALGRNPKLTALALSDSLGGIRLAVRAAGESEWTEIGDAALSGTMAAHSFVWDTAGWTDGEYEARFTAYSDLGVESEPRIAAYSLHLTDNLTPPAVAYSIAPDTMNVELNWPSVPDAAVYDIYRRIGESGEPQLIARANTPSFTNELGVDGTYYYTVRAMDVYGNAMDSEAVLVEVPFADVMAPAASLGFSERRAVLGETILSAEDSSDNVGIVEYEWTVDGAVIGHGIRTSHNFTELGVHMVFLSARDEAGHISQAEGQVEVVDPEGTEMSTVTVFDKSSGSRLARATVQVMEEGGGGEVQELVTDANGTCVFVLDKEREYVGRVYRNGYTSRSFTVDKSGSAVSLSTEPPITGKLTWERMDMAAILAAGIDVRDPANQQVYKFTIQMTLSQSVTMHVNGNGTVLHNSGASGNAQVIPPQRPGQAPQVVYIEIDGEARWLKEMFDVKLLVFNTSEVDLVTNADAELVLPQGLSLAGMKSGLQFQKVRIGEIEPGASSETHWYVRGDKEGEYELSAKFHGLLMPFADEINIEFRADKKLKVYAGRAMEMHVFYMREIVDGFMPILVQLKNVVDFSIYNLSLELADYRYEITDDDGNLIQDTVTGSGRSAYVSELRPGENLNILYHVDFADIEGMNIVDDAFVEQLLVVTRDGSTTEIPVYITEIDGRDTTTTLPGGMKVDSDGRKEMPNGTVIWPDGRVELPDGTVIWPGGLITFSDAWSTRIDADRNVTGVIQGIFMPVPPPEGVTIEEDGTVTLPDGTVVGPDGRVTLPDGTVVLPGGYVILPDGTMINPDGTRAPGKYFPDGMKQPADGIQTGFFSYASHSDKKDYPARYYYSDEYFSGISSEYNPSLATMSMCLTMSAFGSNIVDYPEKSVNAKALLTELGFTGFAASPGFLIKPEKDTIGAVAAHKKVVFGEDEDKDEYTLIAAAVRGGGYMGEWASNFTIGTSGTHQGFNEAKEQVFDFLDGYVKSQGITGEVKVWITGYSRAGATANLVAGEIDGGRRVGGIGGIGGIAVKPENLYAYTFETPAGALESAVRSEKLYKNIFNHLNPHDPVSRVAPARWDFVRYGEDIYFPFRGDRTYLTELLPAMLAQHEQLQSESGYIVDDFVRWQTSIIDILTFKLTETESRGFQNYFLDEAVDMLIGEMFVSRPNYVSVWQADMREILYVAMGLDAADKSRFETYLRQELWDALPQLLPLAMEAGAAFISSEAARKSPNPIIWLGGHALSVAKDHALVELRDKLLECLMNSLNQAGITNYTSGDVERMADYLTVAVAGLFNSHRDEVVTIIANLKRLGAAHYPELCLAWLRAMDGNYANKVIVFDKIFGYTTVSINCPVDIEVYDESDRLVAVIAGDEAPDLGSEVLAVVNQDGEKLFYLPAHESYRLEIKATADGSMSYAVQERSLDTGGVQRLVAYYDLPLLAGDRYTAFVSAHDTDDPEGSNMEYSLLDVEGRPAAAAEELRGEKAAEAYYMIDVWTAEPERGTALGGGVRRLGHYAQVTAMATPGHIFAGWYEDEEMVSAEAEYRFAARRNMALEARFDSDPQGPGDSDLQNPDTQDPNDPDPQSPDDPDPQNPGGSDPQNPNPQDPNTSDPQAPNNPDPGSQTPDPPNPDQQPPKPTSPWRGSVSTPSIAGSAPVSIGGANRVLTSIAISRYGWTTADTVIIASGADANLVDALAAAPLAGQENAPILLCLGDELDPTVLEELRRLNPEKIYTVGAVSPAVIDRLTAETDWSVESLKGRDRFETAALIGAKVENPQGVFVVGYNAVADAVSAASYAAAHGYLIQIARPDGWLARPLPTDHLYILGGPALVQDIPGAERIAGLDRYATNQALRDTLTFNSEHIYIADGLTLVDALTGSALAAQTGSAIVLSPRDNISNADLDADSKVYVLGGGNE
ncbi:MAG: cell wall-binding repeat-containing protein [Gracilibacteraceae bacterium]|nr:cell wall-binding repeat-containing protein [Gracilibacteraceae bacterium]